MENFSYSSYADSGDSSPRSREIEFESVAAPPWDQNYRAKFMCSYGGKILPRPHDNSLCYVGGETKILAVDRAIKLATMVANLSALFGGVDDVSFKYQLPGEDLDALISVTNDDDLELMMCEYDRLYRAAARPARMRLFLFPAYGPRAGFAAEGLRADRDVFVEALNLGPNMAGIMAEAMAANGNKPPNTVDFLFGLEKYVTPSAPPAPPPLHAVGARPAIENFARVYPTAHNYYAAVAAAAAAAAKVVPEKIPVNVSGAVSVPVSAGYLPERTITSGGFPAAVMTSGVGEQPVYVIPSSGGVSAVFHPPMGRVVGAATAASQASIVPPAILHPKSIPEVYRERAAYGMIQPPPPPPPPISSAVTPKIVPVSGAPAGIIPPLSAASPIIPPLSGAVLPNIPPLSAPATARPAPPPPPLPYAFPPYSASVSPVVAPPQLPKMSAAMYVDSVAAAAAGIVRTSGGFAVATSDANPYGPMAYEAGATPRHVYYAAPGGRMVVAPPLPALPHSLEPVAAVGASAARGGGGLGLDGKFAKVPGPV